MSENEIAKRVLDCAFVVHTKLGPGLLESVYEVVMAHELRKKGLTVERQKPMPITYDGRPLRAGLSSRSPSRFKSYRRIEIG